MFAVIYKPFSTSKHTLIYEESAKGTQDIPYLKIYTQSSGYIIPQ